MSKLGTIVYSHQVDTFFLMVAVVNCLGLALYDKSMDHKPGFRGVLYVIDLACTLAFTVEAVLKVCVSGLPRHNYQYWKLGWNRLDLFIVGASVVSLPLGTNARAVRGLQALKPLRLINRVDGVRAVMQTLLYALPSIGHVVAFCSVVWVVFAILGVQLFKGRLSSCNDDSIKYETQCIGHYNSTSGAIPRQWRHVRDWHFDHVFAAMLTLFEVAVLEEWPDIMNGAMDVVGPGRAPEPQASKWHGLYFLVFVIVGAFYMLNVFISVVIDAFNQRKTVLDGLTVEQRDWVNTHRLLAKMRPPAQLLRLHVQDKHPARRLCLWLVNQPYWEPIVGSAILLNTCLLGAIHAGQSERWGRFLDVGETCFVIIFTLEILIRVAAYRVRRFLRDRWNIFDSFVVVLSLIGLGLPTGPTSALRIARASRLIRLVRQASGLSKLFDTLVTSLPAVYNVGVLFLLGLYVFSVLGMNLWGHVARSDNLDSKTNFESFPVAMLVTFCIASTEGWLVVLRGCSLQPPLCDEAAGNCGNPSLAVAYCLFFMLFALVMLNLLIAVVLDTFTDLDPNAPTRKLIGSFEVFRNNWVVFDHRNTLQLHVSHFSPLLKCIPPPLGFGPMPPHTDVLRRLRDMDVPLDKNRHIHYHVALHRMTQVISESCGVDETLLPTLKRFSKALGAGDETAQFTAVQWYAVMMISAWWRTRRPRLGAAPAVISVVRSPEQASPAPKTPSCGSISTIARQGRSITPPPKRARSAPNIVVM